MYKIFDYNDEYTGISFDYYSQAEKHLENCPDGNTNDSIWDKYSSKYEAINPGYEDWDD